MVKKNLVHSSKRLFQVEKEMTTYLEKCSKGKSARILQYQLAEELLLHFFDKLISNTALRFISLFFLKKEVYSFNIISMENTLEEMIRKYLISQFFRPIHMCYLLQLDSTLHFLHCSHYKQHL